LSLSSVGYVLLILLFFNHKFIKASFKLFYLQNYHERLLNRLPFDCLYGSRTYKRNYSQEELQSQQICLKNSFKIRELYKGHLNNTISWFYSSIIQSIRRKMKTDNFQLLCDMDSSVAASLKRVIGLNGTDLSKQNYSLTLKYHLEKVIQDHLLQPYELTKDSVVANLEEVAELFSPKLDSLQQSNCITRASKSDLTTMATLTATYFLLTSSSTPMPLGTLLRKFPGYQSRHSLNVVREKLEDLLDEYLGFDTPATYLIKLNFFTIGRKHCSIIDSNAKKKHKLRDLNDNLCQGANFNSTAHQMAKIKEKSKPKDMNKAATLSLQPFTIQMREKEYEDLAVAAATAFGVDKDALLPHEKVTFPILWFCKGKGNEDQPCPRTQVTYTDRGLGYSINTHQGYNLMTSDSMDSDSSRSQNDQKLNASDELQLYIYNNAHKNRCIMTATTHVNEFILNFCISGTKFLFMSKILLLSLMGQS